jgi:hypothetical protein
MQYGARQVFCRTMATTAVLLMHLIISVVHTNGSVSYRAIATPARTSVAVDLSSSGLRFSAGVV